MNPTNRNYHEPELQKMAAFLRERCDRGKYGLRYLNPEKTRIRIPWPTVSRQQEEVPESFDMFSEWACLSFRKRGNRIDMQENETTSAKKHRFRNALARADGLRQCKDMSTDTNRVYEFADTKGDREQRDNGNNRTPVNNAVHSSTHFATLERMEYPYIVQDGDISDSSCQTVVDGGDYYFTDSPMTMTASPTETPGYQNPGHIQEFGANETLMLGVPSINSFMQELLNDSPPDIEQVSNVVYQQCPGGNLTYTVPQPAQNGVLVTQQGPSSNLDYTVSQPTHDGVLVPQQGPGGDLTYTMSQSAQLAQPVLLAQQHGYRMTQSDVQFGVEDNYAKPEPNNCMSSMQEHHIDVKISFRSEDVKQTIVTNRVGFRLYSGNNIPDMSRLLDNAQRKRLESLTRFNSDTLYGPDSIQQIQVPFPPSRGRQSERTSTIIENMDRGILFYLYWPPQNESPYQNATIPEVWTIRLCQSRVFPYGTNVQDRELLEREGLKRVIMTKIFDPNEFLYQMQKWSDFTGQQQLPPPSPTIHLAVGQKPRSGDSNLVSIALTVIKARECIDKKLEDQMTDILISDKTSMDNAAQFHKDQITSTIRLDDVY